MIYVVYNWNMKKLIPQSVKNIYHLFQAILANFIHGFPSKKIKVIGVTGTDGKTTTVQMIARILETAGKKTAIASTINFRINGEETENQTKFTTSSSFQVQRFIKKAVKKDCEYLVLETSSHSLDQYRVWGVRYSMAIVTNVTREHLDYHKTMEGYRRAKLKLFQNVETAIVNLDMEKPEEFLSCKADKKFGYTTKNEKENNIEVIRAEDIELGEQNTKFKIKDAVFKLNLPGIFNVENALAAICVGISEGINLETIKNGLKKIEVIPGRIESVPNKKEFNIIVDFALTPHALFRLYTLVSQIKKQGSKVVAVFGACGERDRGKRPIIGKIVSENADFVIVTDDEPYHEDPKRIIKEISDGIKDKIEGKNFWKISDRREAIKKALLLAKQGDFVVVTGMGAEDTRAVGDQKIPWNDREVILEELEKLI